MLSDPGPATRALRYWTVLCGAGLLGLGIGVMGGRALGGLTAAGTARFALMPFDTGLAFALSGAALLLLEGRRAGLARGLALVVVVGALASAAQYVFGVDLGLERALLAVPGTSGRTPPHMAPNTSLGLLLGGAALALAATRPRVAAVCANAAIAIGGVAGLGHLLGARDAYSWGDHAMASATAWALPALGSAVVAYVVRHELRVADRSARWVPWATGAFAALATLLLWRASLEQRTFSADRLTQTAAAAIARDLGARVDSISAALEVLDARLPPEARAGDLAATRELRWEVRSIHRRFPSVLVIERAAPGQMPPVVAWTRLPADSAHPLGGQQRTWFTRAARSRRTLVTPVFRLPDRHPAVRIIVPIRRDGPLPGYIAAIVRADKLVASQLRNQGPEYAVEVAIGPTTVMRLGRGPADDTWTYERVVEVGAGPPWRVRVSPAGVLLGALDNQLPEVVLGAGLLVALLLVIALRLATDATGRARSLAQEVRHRHRVETDLRRLGAELEQRVDDRTRELSAVNAALGAENRLRRVVQTSLARSNDDLRQFAAFVSHELRQPLATMSIWTDLLREDPSNLDGERAERYLTKIRDSIDRMSRLIEGELALSQVAGTEFARDRVDLTELVPEVVGDLDGRLRDSGGRVDLGPLPVVCGDATQLRTLFRNLIENALKYRRPGVPPVIHIVGERRAERAEDGSVRCEVRVEDNGQGFTHEDAEVIFAIYRRRARGGEAPGSGIGLAICRRIVDRHGGTIAAEGRPGEGALFRIDLPGML
jgi:signal transduction histidine kinase